MGWPFAAVLEHARRAAQIGDHDNLQGSLEVFEEAARLAAAGTNDFEVRKSSSKKSKKAPYPLYVLKMRESGDEGKKGDAAAAAAAAVDDDDDDQDHA